MLCNCTTIINKHFRMAYEVGLCACLFIGYQSEHIKLSVLITGCSFLPSCEKSWQNGGGGGVVLINITYINKYKCNSVETSWGRK